MTVNLITEDVVEAVARAICVACEENPDHQGDARGNEFRWQDYRDTALAAINALNAAQQQGGGEAGAFDANFLRHIASVCRATYDLCQPKPQRTPEDVREHYGELCLLELTSIADEIERRLTASSGKAGEVAGWVRGDTFVDAKFWTADTPPQGWTPVYLTASQTAAVAAIQFALSNPEGMTFLRMWNEGEFDTLRREWPEAPSEVYVGADPLAAAQKQGQLNVGAPRTPEQIAATVAWVQSLADSDTTPQPMQQGDGEDAPPSATVWVEGRYHPCTHILIDGLKRLEGGTAVLAEWDRARAQADAALAQQPAAVDAEVWLFKGTDGEWRTFHNEQHMLDTIADGRWEVRKFYACTPPVVWEEGE